MSRDWSLKLDEYGIGEKRYKELKWYCLQYPEYKAQAASLLGIQGHDHIAEYHNRRGKMEGTVLPTGKGSTGDPVARAAEKRERLMRDVELIDGCAEAVRGGVYRYALILNVCYGISFEKIDPSLQGSSNRESFFRARREFFFLLDQRKMELAG